MTTDPMENVIRAGGRIVCPRCRATSKRTGLRCSAPAERGKAVCRFHGARSTGPKTAEGRARVVAAHWKHGRRSKEYVAARKRSCATLALAAKVIGLLNRLEREQRETVTTLELLAAGLTLADIASITGSDTVDVASGDRAYPTKG
jgi:hypothetical protein